MCRGELIPGLQLAQTKTMQKKKEKKRFIPGLTLRPEIHLARGALTGAAI